MHDRSAMHPVRNTRVVAPALIQVAYQEEQKVSTENFPTRNQNFQGGTKEV